jgi:hypothetical protein
LYETWEDSFQLLFRWEEAVLEKMSDSVIEFDVEVNTIAYKIVWKGKDKALAQLYGTWEDSFQLLFRWKEAVMEKMSDSVIEFDVEVKDEKLFFRRFFCALDPCLKGFHEVAGRI